VPPAFVTSDARGSARLTRHFLGAVRCLVSGVHALEEIAAPAVCLVGDLLADRACRVAAPGKLWTGVAAPAGRARGRVSVARLVRCPVRRRAVVAGGRRARR